MTYRMIILFLGIVLPPISFAQKMRTASGEYTYYAPENITLEEARRTALERAKIQIVADNFGTFVEQSTSTRVKNRDGHSEIDQFLLADSEIKGEWIETVGEPEYRITFEQGMLAVRVKVTGRIREVVRTRIDLEARILCNGTEPRFERAEFRDGDDMYLFFRSPTAGFLSVYLYDGQDQVYCLLPYRRQEAACQPIRAHESYLFFYGKAEQADIDPWLIDEYSMVCSGESEFNRIYLVFSKKTFDGVLLKEQSDESRTLPRQTDIRSFRRWLAQCRRFDRDMQVEIRDLTISR